MRARSAAPSTNWCIPMPGRRSTRSPASRRAASSSAAPSPTRFRPASSRSARRASCRTRPCASPTAWNTGSTRWRCTRTRLSAGEKVILVDDLIATGGTAEGAVKLLAPDGRRYRRRLLRHRPAGSRRPQEARGARRAGPHADCLRGRIEVGSRRRLRGCALPGPGLLASSARSSLQHAPLSRCAVRGTRELQAYRPLPAPCCRIRSPCRRSNRSLRQRIDSEPPAWPRGERRDGRARCACSGRFRRHRPASAISGC